MHLSNLENHKLFSDEIHLWQTSFSRNTTIEPYIQVLSEDEIVRANAFKFIIDRTKYVIARGILRILLGHYLNKDPKKIVFSYSEYGKPDCSNTKNLKFNVSHSGDMAIFGFISAHAIGVDIEEIKNDFDTLEIASNFFSTNEIIVLRDTIPDLEKNRAFYRCWTRKEAFIKAEGSGLSFPLDRFTVSLDHDIQATLLETKWKPQERLHWHLSSFVPAPNYIAAIATRTTATSIKYFNWDTVSRLSS